MKKITLFTLAAVLATGIQSCKKNDPIKPEAKEETPVLNFKQAVACPAPPTIIGAIATAGPLQDLAGRVTVDNSGNVTITGAYQSTVDFDPGAGVSTLTGPTASGVQGLYLQKLNSSGQFISVTSGGYASNHVYDIYDTQGNKYVNTWENVPGATGENFTKIIVSKTSPANNVIWRVTAGTTIRSAAISMITNSIRVDKNGNLFVANPRGELYKFNSSGEQVFMKKHEDFSNKIEFDKNGNIYLFSIRTGTIQKFAADGSLLWVVRNYATAINPPAIAALTVDGDGNVYTVGNINETTDIDPGPGVTTLIKSTQGSDMFVQKLNPAGQFVWATQTRGGGLRTFYISPMAITLDPTGENVVVVGSFYNTVNFKGYTGTLSLTSKQESHDSFVLGIKQCK